MPAYDNNKNPMPKKICIRNEDWSTSSISYDSYINIYEAMCKKEFAHHCKILMQTYAGNHMFKIKVPKTIVYSEDYYTIRGTQNAVMFMHILALITGEIICLQDKDMKNLVSVEVDQIKGYRIHLDKDFINRLGYGPDDEVKECLSYNGEIWTMLNKYSFENYDKNFIVRGKPIFQTLGFIYAIKDAAELSLNSDGLEVYIYDGNENVICTVMSKQTGYATIATSGRHIGTYKFEWLATIQASTINELIKKLTTNIEYICDKLLDDKYGKMEAGVDISKLSQNIRSFM